jgi:hypothetical protein
MLRQSVGVLLGILALGSANLYAAERIALVIGNGKYQHIGVLKNPPMDVRLVSAALEDVGFDVTTRIDAGEDDMIDSLHAFSDKIDAAGKDTIGLFYFAGHGINYAGNNWLIPVDAKVRRGPDIEREAVSAHFVLGLMEDQKNLMNIIILDACRDNPFKDVALSTTRSLRTGMAAMKAPSGSFIAFSTAEGDVAYDGRGAYSPFAEAFASEIRTPDITIHSMMTKVNAKVDELTKDLGSTEQVPWARYSLKEDFYFNKRAGTQKQAAGSVEPVPSPQLIAKPKIKTREEREVELWNDIKNSEDPDEFSVFLKKYPDGEHADLAKVRQAKFSNKPEKQAATQASAMQPATTQPQAAQRGAEPDLAALCRQFAAGDSSEFADCMDDMAGADEDDWYPPDDWQAGTSPQGGNYPQNMPNQQMSTTATWYDDEYTQWQVIITGDNFTASALAPGSGAYQLRGQSQGYGLSYGIFDATGQQIGYGQGTIVDASHIAVTSYWSNGTLLGSTRFHVNHTPQ